MERLTTAEFWDGRWGEVRASGRSINAAEFGSFIRRVLTLVPVKGRVLELGAAPGLLAVRYHEARPDLTLDGLDISRDGIEAAHKLYRRQGINGVIRHGDMFDVDVGEEYDLVCSHGLIEHFDDFEAALAAHFRFVRSGGVVAITVPNYANPFVTSLLRHFSHETLKTHNLACMSETALSEAVRKTGAHILDKGSFGGAVIPNSAPNPGLVGSIFKGFARGWNAAATGAARLGLTPRFWDAQLFIVAR